MGFAMLACIVGLSPALASPETTITWVTATAYNSVPEQTDSTPWIAAWGDRLSPDMKIIAVSRDLLGEGWLTRGTKVRIEGLEKARRWGVREVQIEWTRP